MYECKGNSSLCYTLRDKRVQSDSSLCGAKGCMSAKVTECVGAARQIQRRRSVCTLALILNVYSTQHNVNVYSAHWRYLRTKTQCVFDTDEYTLTHWCYLRLSVYSTQCVVDSVCIRAKATHEPYCNPENERKRVQSDSSLCYTLREREVALCHVERQFVM